MTIIHRCHNRCYLEDEDGWETEAEFVVLGLMVPYFHAEQGTDTATGNGYPDEACLGDAPFVMARLPFVDAVQEERDDIDYREVNQKAK